MAMVTAAELGAYMQAPVNGDAASAAIRVAQGELRSVMPAFPDWPPDPPPEDLWSWTVKLAAINYSNPAGQTVSTRGGQTDEYNAANRADILAAAASRYGGTKPVGSFPPAPPELRS